MIKDAYHVELLETSWSASYAKLDNFVDGNLTDYYCYGSTKEDLFSAVMMNLPIDVLGYVPWLSEYENSKQGDKPQGFTDWFMEVLEDLWGAIAGLVAGMS